MLESLTRRCTHNNVCSAERTISFALSLNLDDTSDTKDVLTIESDWSISDGKADWAEVVVNLRHNRDKLLGHAGAHVFRHAASQKWVRVQSRWKCSRNAKLGTFVELCDTLAKQVTLNKDEVRTL